MDFDDERELRNAPGSDLLAGLDEDQLRAVTHPGRVLRVQAAAGSGKTRVLTRRIAYQAAIDAIDPRRTLAITFTRTAAAELTERLRSLGLRDGAAAGTFHSVALAQLRESWKLENRRAPSILERRAGFIARLTDGRRGRDVSYAITAEIEWAKARRIRPENYAVEANKAQRSTSVPFAQVTETYERYEEEKRKRRVIDFDDILTLCGSLLQRNAEAAAAFRWRFRNIFVDEFQDVNPLQFALLRVMLGEDPMLCVVGDSRQAIYAWNGADSQYLNGLTTWFPQAETVELARNYRSSPQIIRGANSLATENTPLTTNRPKGSPIRVEAHRDDEAEAAFIARRCREAKRGDTSWKHMAVLVRTNAQIDTVRKALDALNIPNSASSGDDLLSTPEVSQLIDQIDSSRLPLRAALIDVETGEEDLHPETPEITQTAATASARRRSEERTAQFLKLAREHLSVEPDATLDSLLGALKRTNPKALRDAVDIATFHSAKGLEWKVVHIAGLEDGLSPISHASSTEAIAEERRLLYVALTRARESANLHWSHKRRFGARNSDREMSPFLHTVLAACDPTPPKKPTGITRVAKAASSTREPLTAEGPLERLSSWRSSTSKASLVPAKLILSDGALAEIAANLPDDESELAGIAGVGKLKAARWGSGILQALQDPGR